ncbi:MAG: NAD(P)-dependent oxidoreductase [Rhizobiaceae bacterium]
MKARKIGFIGLGLMGHGMAKNLVEKGHQLSIIGNRNRAPVEDLVSRGAKEVKKPSELAATCDIVFTCVPASTDVEAIVYGADGFLKSARPGLVHVDCTTANPTSTLKIAADYAAHGVQLVDAGLARGPDNAEAGTLNLIVGAEAGLLEDIRPVLLCCAENIFHVGPTGAGHRTKLINNFIAMGMAGLFADALTAARATNVDLSALYEVISAGGNNSAIFQIMAKSAMDGDASRLKFSIGNARKDMSYFVGMASDAGMVSLFGPAVLQAFTLATLNGQSDGFVPSISDVLAQLNHLETRRTGGPVG